MPFERNCKIFRKKKKGREIPSLFPFYGKRNRFDVCSLFFFFFLTELDSFSCVNNEGEYFLSLSFCNIL